MATSDYRGPSQSTNVPTIFPKKEQAIVIDVNENLRLNDYVTTIGKIVEPKNVFAASRISNNRVCIYLTDVKLVDMVTDSFPTIKIEEYELNVRRLVTPARRVILSNVCPSIPHNILISVLLSLGLKPASQMTFLRAGRLDEEYSHVFSFRRQIYLLPNDSVTLPSSVVVKYENTNYRIFLSYDELICFTCKDIGHIAANCPTKNASENRQTQNDILPSGDEMSDSEANNSIEPRDPPTPELQTKPLKRGPPSTTPSITRTTSIECKTQEPTNNTPGSENLKLKKLKKSDSTESLTSIDEHLSPIKPLLDKNPDSYILDYDQLLSFLENVYGSSDPISVAKQYTDDINELLIMLENIYPLLEHRSIKNRITRMQKKIRKQIQDTQNVAPHSSLESLALSS